jgi:hypothetical protein
MRRGLTLVLGIGLLMALAACGGGSTQSAASAVEDYLRTRITGDEARLVALTCREREADARGEAASFAAMKAEVQDVTCREDGADGTFTVVACQGTMVTSYAGETRNWDLADRAFRAMQEDGAWKVCGYAARD